MEKYFNTGTIFGGGFDLGAQTPLDNRTVLHTINDMQDVPVTRLYEGLIIYIEDEKQYYGLIELSGSFAADCKWEKLGAVIEWEDIDSVLEEYEQSLLL